MKIYLEKHHKIFGAAGGLATFVVGIIYLVVVPEVPAYAGWTQRFILLYGHSLCWFLLCAASVLWLLKGGNKLSAVLVYMSLATYLIFLSILLFI